MNAFSKVKSYILSKIPMPWAKPKIFHNNIRNEMVPSFTRLIWKDEFEGQEINPLNWSFETEKTGWKISWNNEWQDYIDNGKGGETAFIENGVLKIKAIHTSEKIYPGEYSSARLTTKGKHSWQYGRIAARIKLPYGNGIWPAFWLQGDNWDKVGFPKCGEIDILEMIGGKTGEKHDGGDHKIFGTLHGPGHFALTALSNYSEIKTGIFHDDFHVFEIIWDKNGITWLLDQKPYFQILRDIVEEWVFDHPFYIILNLAAGGFWPGYPDLSAEFPQEMQVDWVRVYQ
jgi:beta-glucanase (GH16 family)